MNLNEKLRALPSVTDVLKRDDTRRLIEENGRALVTYAVRSAVSAARDGIRAGDDAPGAEDIVQRATRKIDEIRAPSLKRVINATGIILHTNLGRAPLGEEAIAEIARTAGNYSNLEYDMAKAARGDRNVHLRELLRILTGAQDALVVNNNAAAIILALHTLAPGRDVVVSRGELIEIGGSFRIPEIMAAGGARMKEIGTTNRTHLTDYENAIDDNTAMLFKAHKSNYAVKGFTKEVTLKEVAAVAHAHDLPMVYDIGSGLLRKPQPRGSATALADEPDVKSALADGADLVTFSSDKLMGGPQGGVIVGKKDLVVRLAEAPLMRAVRVGKLTVAALSVVCRQYLRDENLVTQNPVFEMLERSPERLLSLADALVNDLKKRKIAARQVSSSGRCGGGTMPELELESVAVEILPVEGMGNGRSTFAELLHRQLLDNDPPVLAVLREGKLLIDMLTMFEDDISEVAGGVARGVRRIEQEVR